MHNSKFVKLIPPLASSTTRFLANVNAVAISEGEKLSKRMASTQLQVKYQVALNYRLHLDDSLSLFLLIILVKSLR